MTFIKELIDIPERVQRGDFVLRLSEGVNRAEESLREYVVTPELRECFDNALAFIRSALQTNTSKASYLHAALAAGKVTSWLSCIVLFKNIRELPDTSLENHDEQWKLVIGLYLMITGPPAFFCRGWSERNACL
jgi:hypothetical protein